MLTSIEQPTIRNVTITKIPTQTLKTLYKHYPTKLRGLYAKEIGGGANFAKTRLLPQTPNLETNLQRAHANNDS